MNQPGRSLRRACAVAALSALLLTACGQGEKSPGGDGAEPADETARLAQACTEVINERDHDVFADGGEASFQAFTAAVTDDPLTDAEVESFVEQISALQSLLESERDDLADVSDDPDWSSILDAYDDTLESLDIRRTALEEGDYEAIHDTIGEAFFSPDVEALEALDLVDRDCQALLTVPGPEPEHAEFVSSAANTCRDIVDRRRIEDVEASRDLSLEIVAAVLTDEPVPEGDKYLEALEAVAEEWALTAEDLQAVDAADVPDEAAWTTVLESAEANADSYRARVDAWESGDADQIEELFQPGTAGNVDFPWEQVHLGQRDCRRLAGVS